MNKAVVLILAIGLMLVLSGCVSEPEPSAPEKIEEPVIETPVNQTENITKPPNQTVEIPYEYDLTGFEITKLDTDRPVMERPGEMDVITGWVRLSGFDASAKKVALYGFEYSKDGEDWLDIDGTHMAASGDIFWDTADLESGQYQLRMWSKYTDGTKAQGEPADIIINKPPEPKADLSYEGGKFVFNGSKSTDSDGKIVGYEWEVGEEIKKAGPVVRIETDKLGTEKTDVTLSVTDDMGTEKTIRGEIRPSLIMEGIPTSLLEDDFCGCTAIRVRSKGPSGKYQNNRNFSLGPISKTFNVSKGGIKKHILETGHSFEVVADITGNPHYCSEKQEIKVTYTEVSEKWGTYKLHYDGLDEKGKVKLSKDGQYPADGEGFGPNNYKYESSDKFYDKKGKKIRWADMPRMRHNLDILKEKVKEEGKVTIEMHAVYRADVHGDQGGCTAIWEYKNVVESNKKYDPFLGVIQFFVKNTVNSLELLDTSVY